MTATPSPSRPAAPRPRLLPAWLPWAFVAVLAIACAWLFQLCLTLRTQNSLLQQQLELNSIQLRSTEQHLEAERILHRHLVPRTAPPDTPAPAR